VGVVVVVVFVVISLASKYHTSSYVVIVEQLSIDNDLGSYLRLL
jgi:hypothetical protein